ncbi:MAG: M48 family metallopeptidase [Rhodobacteraceae bacterium]|nr:M48 family metallopeptidase [Paracoccaceae bacterium]
MGQATLPGSPDIPITLRRSGRARRMSLRVSRLDGRVTLSIPSWTSEREALSFVREKEGWIRKALAETPGVVVPRIGGTVLFEGREVPVLEGAGRGARYADGAFHLAPGARVGPALAGALKVMARDRLAEAVSRHSAAIGRDAGSISLRDTRSRWGSCASSGNLMFSWRLVMAPPEVLDYVAAHEVAHLAEMNHSPAFWQQVERLMPGYRPPRRWLRENGALLHRYKFGD